MEKLVALVFAGLISVPVLPVMSFGEGSLEELLFLNIPTILVASNKQEKAETAPAVVSVITAEQIERSGVRTISEALQRVPGFYPSRQFFHDDLLGVRGYFNHTNDKIVLLIDGHNITRNGWTCVMTGDLDELMSLDKVARIEVMHGPGSIVWGDNAMLAVINVVTKNPKDINGTNVSYTYGKFDQSSGGLTRILGVTYGKEYDNGDGILLSANFPSVEGWVSKNYAAWFRETVFTEARVDNFDTRFQSYELFGKLNKKDWTLQMRAMNAHQDIAVFQYPGQIKANENKFDFSSQNFSMVAERKNELTADLNMNTEFSFERYHYNWYGFSFGGNAASQLAGDFFAADQMVQDNNSLSVQTKFEYTGLPEHDIMFGIGAIMQQYEPNQFATLNLGNINNTINISSTNVAAVWLPGTDYTATFYVQDTYRLMDSLRLVGGFRWEWNDPREDGKGILAPRVAAIYSNSDESFVAKYMYNTGYRRATWWQNQWPAGSMGTSERADKSETSQNHDLQFIYNIKKVGRLNLVLFREDTKNIITNPRNPNGTGKIWVNFGDFSSDGIEAEISFYLPKESAFGFTAAWMRTATITSNIATLPSSTLDTTRVGGADRYLDYPAITATGFINLMLTKKVYTDFTVRYLTAFEGRQFTDDSSGTILAAPIDLQVNDIVYMDVTVGTKPIFKDMLSFSLRVLNLVDNQTRIPQGQGDHDLYQPEPRYVELKTTYHF